MIYIVNLKKTTTTTSTFVAAQDLSIPTRTYGMVADWNCPSAQQRRGVFHLVCTPASSQSRGNYIAGRSHREPPQHIPTEYNMMRYYTAIRLRTCSFLLLLLFSLAGRCMCAIKKFITFSRQYFYFSNRHILITKLVPPNCRRQKKKRLSPRKIQHKHKNKIPLHPAPRPYVRPAMSLPAQFMGAAYPRIDPEVTPAPLSADKARNSSTPATLRPSAMTSFCTFRSHPACPSYASKRMMDEALVVAVRARWVREVSVVGQHRRPVNVVVRCCGRRSRLSASHLLRRDAIYASVALKSSHTDNNWQ